MAALELERPMVHELEESRRRRRRSRSAPARCSRICRRAPAETEERARRPRSRPPRPRRLPPSRCRRAWARRAPPARPRPRRRSSRPGSSGPPAAAPRGPKPVFSSSAPVGAVAPRRPSPVRRTPAAGQRRPAPPRTFGPDAEKGGGRKKGKKGKRSSVDQDAVQANILKTLQGMKGRPGARAAPADEPSLPRAAGRPHGGGEGAGEDPDPGQRVHLGLRAGRSDEGARHPDRPVRVQGAGPDGDGQPAARLRPDRADRVGVRVPGGARGRVRGRAGDEEAEDERRSSWRRGRRSSPSWATSTTARRRCSTTSARPTWSPARRAASPSTSAPTTSTLPGERSITFLDTPGPRGVHRHARPRRAGHRHRRAGGRGRRPGHAADGRGDQPRQERRRADHRRHQQDRPAHAPTCPRSSRTCCSTTWCSRSSAATVLSAEISAKKGTGIDDAARADPAPGRDPRPQGQSRAARATARCSRPRSIRARARWPPSWCSAARCAAATTSSAASSPAACARCTTSAARRSRRPVRRSRCRSSGSRACRPRATSSPS